jgi:probable addiction module antidote protein
MPRRVKSHDEFAKRELFLDSDFAAQYLNAALQDDDPDVFLGALRRVAEAYRISAVASSAGVERESLYRMLKPGGNPSYRNLWGILRAVGLQLGARIPTATESRTRSASETTPHASGHQGTVLPFIRPRKGLTSTADSRQISQLESSNALCKIKKLKGL